MWGGRCRGVMKCNRLFQFKFFFIFILMFPPQSWLIKCLLFLYVLIPIYGGRVLFVEDVIVAGPIQQEDAGVASFGKNVVIDSPSLSPVHVLHQDGHVQGLG